MGGGGPHKDESSWGAPGKQRAYWEGATKTNEPYEGPPKEINPIGEVSHRSRAPVTVPNKQGPS